MSRNAGRRQATSRSAAEPVRGRRAATSLGVLLACTLACALPACAPGVPQTLRTADADPRADSLFARRMLEQARALEDQGRFEAAARTAARGLDAVPDDAKLRLLYARALEGMGDLEAARSERERADALLPPRPAPPETPMQPPGTGLRVVLLPPEAGKESPSRVPLAWPGGEVADAVRSHLAHRLPEARVTFLPDAPFERAADAAAWLGDANAVLSLRIDRAYCGRTLKDGDFALVWVRLAAAAEGKALGAPLVWREVQDEPRVQGSCPAIATRWALEAVLAQPEARAAVARAAAPRPASAESTAARERNQAWDPDALHALLPALRDELARALAAGRSALSRGDRDAARTAFARAVALHPEDSDARTHLEQIDFERSIAQELDAKRQARTGLPASPNPLDVVALRPDPEELAALEARLREERARRQDLAAALDALDDSARPPSPAMLAALRTIDLDDPRAIGPRLAARRLGRPAPLEARVLYAPDGAVLARFYFGPEGGAPLLREEDRDGDGRPDRWLAFEGGRRIEVWEDDQGTGQPTLHLRYAPGSDTPRIAEIDRDLDGIPEQVFQYFEGRLASESFDADGDGRYERFDVFDEEGRLALREEDVDGDGDIDRRSRFRNGRLVRREILDPALLKNP